MMIRYTFNVNRSTVMRTQVQKNYNDGDNYDVIILWRLNGIVSFRFVLFFFFSLSLQSPGDTQKHIKHTNTRKSCVVNISQHHFTAVNNNITITLEYCYSIHYYSVFLEYGDEVKIFILLDTYSHVAMTHTDSLTHSLTTLVIKIY
jgi:hypothetical protein